MDKVIKLKSRGGSYLQRMDRADGSESRTYILKGDHSVVRVGYTEDNKSFVDPFGGPMLVVGEKVPEANATIKSIDHVYGLGYIITFE